jgi:hypothetical protein
MTIDEQAQHLEHALQQLAFATQRPWNSAEDRREMVRALRRDVAEAEGTLRHSQVTPTAFHAYRRLVLWTEMARGTLEAPEYRSVR